MVTACKPVQNEHKPEVAFCFSTVSVETTTESATITAVEPYMTIDGVKYDDAKISLRYIGKGHDLMNYVEEYSTEGENIIFEIDDLTPNLQYSAYLIVDGGEYGKMESDEIQFTTQKLHDKVTSITCDIAVEAKGLMATANLTNVAYLVDGEAQPLHVIKVEYKRTSAEEWVAKEYNSSAITNGAMSVALPFDGEDYLEENRDYHLRVTLFPKSGDYEPLTSEEFEFETDYAEITANIATPTLSLQGNYISASVKNIEVFYDGIPVEEYKDATPVKYFFYCRVNSAENWTPFEVSATNGDISFTIQAEEGNTYEFMAVIVAGAMQKARESKVAEIEVPKNDTPPTPPITGGGDTSDIAGTWQLTQWRGAEPSFDIYLSITEDGVVTLYQRLESRVWEIFYSSAAFEDGVLRGTYTDGVQWGTSYIVTLNNADTMTWVDATDSSDISVYTRAEIPYDAISTLSAKTSAVATTERFL